MPIHRDTGGGGGGRPIEGRQRAKERRSTYPCFHTGGTSDARYGASRPALAAPYTPMRRVNCPVRYRAARRCTLYARERRIVYTVVPYRWSYCSTPARVARICSLMLHINARRCTSPSPSPSPSDDVDLSLPLLFFPPLSHLLFFFVILSLRRSSSLLVRGLACSASLSSVVQRSYELKRGKGRVYERVNRAILG